ncbi:hypothetical protein L7F22_048604 [Adiantum nelumboides]|nr:hypothetical protein [Adiantum nelumboides]
MEDNGIQDQEAINSFHLIVVPKLRARIVEIQAQQWQDFKKALKEEFFMEDSQRVTKQSFMKWIKERNKGLSARELLREFEKRYDQLFAIEERSIRSEWVELFVQAIDARLQKNLEQLLEDALGEIGLTSKHRLPQKLKSYGVVKSIHFSVHSFCSSYGSLKRVRSDLEDKTKTFIQTLVNEALVLHLQDLKDREDNNKEEEDEDREGQARPPGPPGPNDDDD